MSGFAQYLDRWNLTPDGSEIATAQSRLLPVRQGARPLMLKIADTPEEVAGFASLIWWGGDGVVPVLAHEGDAILMARGVSKPDLAEMARGGQDEQATRILCQVAQRLHAPRPQAFPSAQSMREWFCDLPPVAAREGSIFARAWAEAEGLIASTERMALLHGDLHHDNVLFFGTDWAAIDAKGLIGDPVFDYAILFGNPDLSDPSRPLATLPGVAARRLTVITEESGIPPRHLLRWLFAWSCLSAVWFMGDDPVDEARLRVDLTIAAWAEAQLQG